MKIKAFNAFNNPFFLASLGLHEFNQLAQTYEQIHHDRQQEQGQRFTNAALAEGHPVTEMQGGAFRQFLSKHLPSGWVDPNIEATPGEMAQENVALRGQDENNFKDMMGLGRLRGELGHAGMEANPNSPLGRIEARTGFVNPDQTPGEAKQQQTVERQNRQDQALQQYRQASLDNSRTRMAIEAGHFKVDEGLRRWGLSIAADRESREAANDNLLNSVMGSLDDDTIDKAMPGADGMNKAATLVNTTKGKANLMWARTGDPKIDNMRDFLSRDTGFKQYVQNHPEILINKATLTAGVRAYGKEYTDYEKSQQDIDATLTQIQKLQDFMQKNDISGDSWSDAASGGFRREAQRFGLPQDPTQRRLADMISQLNSTATRSYVTGTRFGSKYLDRITAHLPKEGGTPDSIRENLTDLSAFLLTLKAARTPTDFESKVTSGTGTTPVDSFEAE